MRKYSTSETAEKWVECAVVERASGRSEENILISLASFECKSEEIPVLKRRAQAHCLAFMEKRVASLSLNAEEKVCNACERATLACRVAAMNDV